MAPGHKIKEDGGERESGLVLVADDDRRMRSVLSRFLSLKGCEIAEAADGREAIALVRRKKPDIMLLDIDMPGKSGLEVLAHTIKARLLARRLPPV